MWISFIFDMHVNYLLNFDFDSFFLPIEFYCQISDWNIIMICRGRAWAIRPEVDKLGQQTYTI
jgi:hypothetical protein